MIARAGQVLEVIERGEQSSSIAKLADDLPLFASSPSSHPVQVAPGPSPLEEALDGMHPDEMTPKEALELIYHLKRLLKEPEA